MKKYWFIYFVLGLHSVAFAQSTFLGYDAQFYGSLGIGKVNIEQTFNSTNPPTYSKEEGSLTSFTGTLSYSIIGLLFNKEKRFFLGEQIGVGVGAALAKKPKPDVTPWYGYINLEFGVATAYRFTDDVEVGIKYIVGGFDAFFDLANDYSFSRVGAVIPSVRIKGLIFTAGVGGCRNSGFGGGKYSGNYWIGEVRLIPGDVKESNVFFFAKYENGRTTNIHNPLGKSKSRFFSIGIGMMGF